MPATSNLLRRNPVGYVFFLCGIAALNAGVSADEAAQTGLISALTDHDAGYWTGLKAHGVSIGGWSAAGSNYNTDNPPNNSNGPLSMTDRSNEFNLYQLNLFIEKAVIKSSGWDVGGRLDYMFGTDTRYTQATGHWDSKLMKNSYYNMALPQAYVEVFAPIGNGLNAKFGHFYSIIGYESVPSPLNFFSSHTYSFKSSPFTTTGALFNYSLSEQWNINLGAVTGPDNFDRDKAAWSQMSGLTWANADTGTSLSFSILHGDVYQNQASNLVYYSAIFQQTLGKWRYVLQHDRGTQEHAVNNQTAAWYSIVQYLTYQLNDQWGAGLRGEWFRDQNGFRYANGEAGYYNITAGLNWKPKTWLMLRPEARYDWSAAQTAPYDAARRFDQVVLGVDAVIQF
jgi:Putative beta-barrel porin-2, OmpL-like. bbp2